MAFMWRKGTVYVTFLSKVNHLWKNSTFTMFTQSSHTDHKHTLHDKYYQQINVNLVSVLRLAYMITAHHSTSRRCSIQCNYNHIVHYNAMPGYGTSLCIQSDWLHCTEWYTNSLFASSVSIHLSVCMPNSLYTIQRFTLLYEFSRILTSEDDNCSKASPLRWFVHVRHLVLMCPVLSNIGLTFNQLPFKVLR